MYVSWGWFFFLNNLVGGRGEGEGAPGGNRSGCIHQLKVNICFDEYGYGSPLREDLTSETFY